MKLTRRGFVIATLVAPTAAMVALKGAVAETVRKTVDDPEFKCFEQLPQAQLRGDKAVPGNIVMSERDGRIWLVMPFGVADDFYTLRLLNYEDGQQEKAIATKAAMRRFLIIGAAHQEARSRP